MTITISVRRSAPVAAGVTPLMVAYTCCCCIWMMSVVSAQLLQPIGSAVTPSTYVEQMAFDFANRTVYLACPDRHIILQVSETTTLTLSPFDAAPWQYGIVAGRDGAPNRAAVSEVSPTVATFWGPAGVIGWPWYAVGPYGSASFPATSASAPGDDPDAWIGLWVCDRYNNAIRFINFHRGNTVTLVAGSGSGSAAAQDGIGAAARVYYPWNIAWGHLPNDTVMETGGGGGNVAVAAGGSTPGPAWTSVVYWSDLGNGCVWQGIPLHGTDSSPLLGTPSESLEDMVLNVTSFVGYCSISGRGSGLAYRQQVLYVPMGLTVVNPFSGSMKAFSTIMSGVGVSSAAAAAGMTVMFIADDANNRLCLISPLYPARSRFLTVLGPTGFATHSAQVARVLTLGVSSSSPVSSSSFSSTNAGWVSSTVQVELFVGANTFHYYNVSLTLVYNSSSSFDAGTGGGGGGGSGNVLFVPGSVTRFPLADLRIAYARNTALVRYAPNRSFEGTLVLFAGTSVGGSPSLQFYCCLSVEPSSVVRWVPTTVTVSVVKSTLSSFWVSTSSSATSSRSRCLLSVGSPSVSAASATPSLLVHGTATARPTRRSVSSVVRRATPRTVAPRWATLSRGRDTRRNASGDQRQLLVNRGGSDGGVRIAAASTAVAGIATAVIVPAAASKAATAGRIASIWQCAVVGPAQSAADDPQQFLGFGLRVGGDDGGELEGIVRGALILTSLPRLIVSLTVVSLLRFCVVQPPAFIGVLTAVSVGYFTPNVIGLGTAMLLSGPSHPTSTVTCAVISILVEISLIAIIALPVIGCWGGGPAVLQAAAREYIRPIRRRSKWYYRVAGLEDLLAAILIAVASNVPLPSSSSSSDTGAKIVCTAIAWVLLIIAAFHLLYVCALRPYRSLFDNAIAIFLGAVNAVFALLCCVVSREDGQAIIRVAQIVVVGCFYCSLVLSVAVSVRSAVSRGSGSKKK